MAIDAAQVKSLFLNASDLADPAERAAYLDRECGGDAELRARVEALLRANDAAPLPPAAEVGATVDSEPVPVRPELTGEYIPQPDEVPPHFVPTTAYAPKVEPGLVIANRYTLVEKIGEGGMGEVWVAKQTEPVKRKVALKLIKAGMDSKAVLQRFEAERQALALMDHPHIAKVLDGGLTQDRHPFFVMELVNGLPLNKFCDEAKLTPKERLELFVPICQAVQHAHQKGIIHRDLKPSNILVTLIDGKPVPKVIDFGVAKATAGKLTDESLSTSFGAVVGTLEYMAPEQAGYSGADIDTRADIYSLGVILYEMLTGLRPLDSKRLKKAALTEMIRIIREEEPSKPSTRLSTDEALPSLAASRQTEPKKLMALLRGELDWVVMKCLEKQRERRYETVNGLARDIQRYLADEVVEARPPSAGYRLQKFVRRHQGQVITASLVLLTLLAGIAGTTIGWFEAKKQEQLATASATEERKAKEREAERAEGERKAKLEAQANEKLAADRLVQVEAEKKKAEEEKRIAQAVKDFLQKKLLALTDTTNQANALLKGGGPVSEAKLNPTIRELLDRAARELAPDKIEESFPKQPKLQAEILLVVGSTYLDIGEYQAAIDFLKRADQLFQQLAGPDAALTRNNLAMAYQKAGKLYLALPLYEETLKHLKTKVGPDHLLTIGTMNNLALAYQEAGKLDLALPLYEESLKLRKAKLGPDHFQTFAAMNNLAAAYKEAGKLDMALALLEETLKLVKAKLGPDHPNTLYPLLNLASAYKATGKTELALPLEEEALKLAKAKRGPDHPETLSAMRGLAGTYQRAGKHALALPLLEETLRLDKAKLGPDHPGTLVTMNELALAYQVALGKLDLAVPLFEEALRLQKAKIGVDHPNTHATMNNLAIAYREAKKHDLALPLFEELLKLQKARLGVNTLDTLATMSNLAYAYQAVGKLDLALPLFEETLKLQKAKLGPDSPFTLATMNRFAETYQVAGKLDLALPLLEESLKLRKAKFGPDHPSTLSSMINLGKAYCNAKQGEKAAATSKDFIAGMRKRLKSNDPQFAGQLAQVSLDLLACGQYAVAEGFLRESLAIREQKEPDAWTTFNTQSMLGGALLGQKKYADAEPLLLKGYEGMKAREKTIPPQGKVRLSEALERLVQLYEAMGKKDEAAKWRKELEATKAAQPQTEKKP